MRAIVLIVALLGFLLLPIDHRLVSSDDDDDYFAVASSIAYGKFPSFSDEYHAGELMPFASVGPGVLASPFVFAFSLIDRAKHAPIAQKRDRENRYWTWSVFGFEFAVYVYLLVGLLVTYETLKQWGSEFGSLLATLMIALGGGGLLVYVFRRPVMSHLFEFFTIALGVFLISSLLKGRRLRFHATLVGLCAAFIFLTRYNNVFLSFGLMAVFLFIQWQKERAAFIGAVARVITAYLVPIFIFRLLPVLANGFSVDDQTYGGQAPRLIPELDPLFYWIRIGAIVLGADMGMAYTAPVVLISLAALWLYRNKLPKELLFLSAFVLINFYIAVMWRSFGSYYGYRYVTFTALPLLSVYLVTLIDDLLARFGKITLICACAAIVYFPVMSMLVFERYAPYGLSRITTTYGFKTYTQPTYHKELLLELIHNPIHPVVQAVDRAIEMDRAAFNGALPSEYLLQRLLLYLMPPILFLIFYEFSRSRSQRSGRTDSFVSM